MSNATLSLQMILRNRTICALVTWLNRKQMKWNAQASRPPALADSRIRVLGGGGKRQHVTVAKAAWFQKSFLHFYVFLTITLLSTDIGRFGEYVQIVCDYSKLNFLVSVFVFS
jgi:hypothetical protein